MTDALQFIRLNIRILARGGMGFLLVPALLVFVACGWMIAVVEPHHWNSFLAVAQAEGLGALVAVFVCSGALNPEFRQGCGEMVFCKPYRLWMLLAVRIGLLIVLSYLLIGALLLAYQLHFGNGAIVWGILSSLPGCIFIACFGVWASVTARTGAAGAAATLVWWLWSCTGGLAYNKLLILVGGSLYLAVPSGQQDITLLVLNKVVLLCAAGLFFVLALRRIQKTGGVAEAGSRKRTGRRRIARGAAWAAGTAAYVWTGAIVLLWQASNDANEAHEGFGVSDFQRPIRGRASSPLNRGLYQALSAYGPFPIHRLLGPGASDLFRGLGVGLDLNDPRYEDTREEALLRAASPRSLRFYRERAELELAAMHATPTSVRYGISIGHTEDVDKQFTLGSVDSERWWVDRVGTGLDVQVAQKLASKLLAEQPNTSVGAEAAILLAHLADERWDMVEGRRLRLHVLENAPQTRSAVMALIQLCDAVVTKADAAPLIEPGWAAFNQHGGQEHLEIGVRLAQLNVIAGNVLEAKLVLASLLPVAARLDKENSGAFMQNHANVEQVDSMMKWASRPQAHPAPERYDTCTSSVRLLADKVPISDAAVALIPLREVAKFIHKNSDNWLAPRFTGTVASGKWDYSMAAIGGLFGPANVGRLLQAHPDWVRRTDESGTARWDAAPVGECVVYVRLHSKQLPSAGAGLALAPIPRLVRLSPGANMLPPFQLVSALKVAVGLQPDGRPKLSWPAVPGARSYRVAIRIDDELQQNPTLVGRSFGGGMGLDPNVVWWSVVSSGKSIVPEPGRFVGPSADGMRNGLGSGVGYTVLIEAIGSGGEVLSTSEALAGPPRIAASRWVALTSRADLQGVTPNARGSSLMANPRGVVHEVQAVEFNSPFLDSLMPKRADPATPQGPPRVAPPTAVSEGVGLPQRGPLHRT